MTRLNFTGQWDLHDHFFALADPTWQQDDAVQRMNCILRTFERDTESPPTDAGEG